MHVQNWNVSNQYISLICDVFYRKQTHLGKKSKLRWLLIIKVEIFSFKMIAFLF